MGISLWVSGPGASYPIVSPQKSRVRARPAFSDLNSGRFDLLDWLSTTAPSRIDQAIAA
jgi:hypothetical protein